MKIRELRLFLGKTQDEMAEILEVSKSLYEKMEYGTKATSRKTMQKLKDKIDFLDMNIFFKK